MTSPKTSTFGIASRSDMILLKRVYHRVCREQGIAAGSYRVAQLRTSAVELLSEGKLDEVSLYERLRRVEYPRSLG